MKMNRVILLLNPAKAALLEAMGFTPCGKRQVYKRDVFQFVLTDKLFKVLNDKTQFSKNDYVHDTKLTF
jgi:hypothetical protein